MAAIQDRIYFPSLGNCLKGEQVILSWKLVATALSDPTGTRQKCPPLTEFLSDPYVHEFFRDPSLAFSPPGKEPTAQASFEQKTAAIHVTPSSTSTYDIAVIKDDAVWLSKNAKLNVVAALRIVAIEFQSRAASHLTSPPSAQDASNLESALGTRDSQGSSLTAAWGSTLQDAEDIWTGFEKETSKRQRIFLTYLSERHHFMMTADYIHSAWFYAKLPVLLPSELDVVKLYRLEPLQGKSPQEWRESVVSTYLDRLSETLDTLSGGLSSLADDAILLQDDVEILYIRSALSEIVHILLVVFQALDPLEAAMPSPTIVYRWFYLMESYGFLDQLMSTDAFSDTTDPIRILTCAISLRVLCPTRVISLLTEDGERPDAEVYVTSTNTLEQIHKAVVNAGNNDLEAAHPVILVWTFILLGMHTSYTDRAERRDNLLHERSAAMLEDESGTRNPATRRASAGSVISMEESPYDVFFQSNGLDQDLQYIEQLAQHVSSQGRVYSIVRDMATKAGATTDAALPPLQSVRIRNTLIEFLQTTFPLVGYQAETVSTLLTILSGGNDWASSPIGLESDLLASVLQNDTLLEWFFKESLNRYPYELSPFLSLCTALAQCTSVTDEDTSDIILRVLRKTPTLTLSLPDDFQDYELLLDDDSISSFNLLGDLPLILPSARSRHQIGGETFSIPSGTVGRFVTDTARIVFLGHEHSALALMGRRLQVNPSKKDYNLALGPLSIEEVADIVTLLATLVRAEISKGSEPSGRDEHYQTALDILEEAGRAIEGNRDIFSVVCDTLDLSLQDDAALGEGHGLSVLTACLRFLTAVLPLFPSRVASYLARCELLGNDARAGKLTKIVGNLDIFGVQFEFLDAAMVLFSSFVDSVMTGSVQRRCGNRYTGRTRIATDMWLGVSDKVLSQLTFSIAQMAVDVFENTSTWKFSTELQLTMLIQDVVPLLTKLLVNAHKIGEGDTPDKLTRCLERAAAYITEGFLSPSVGSLRFQPLLSTMVSTFEARPSTLYPALDEAINTRLQVVLDFATTLLRVANYLDRPVPEFQDRLFKCSFLLARLCAVNDRHRKPSLLLVEALVVNAGKESGEPPSLLGHLGPRVAKSFLDLLSRLDKPFQLSDELTVIWHFFSSLIRNRQRWMSNCLITGKAPRDVSKTEETDKTVRSDSVFSGALRQFQTLDTLPASEALALLDFATSAQNYWPWAVFAILQDAASPDGLRRYIRDLKPSALTAKTDPLRAAQEAKAASLVADSFTMQLYHLRHIGDSKPLAQSLLNDIDYYVREAAEVGAYNKSLHANFAKNFANKYPGCSVESFKRTLLDPSVLGNSYFYNLGSADEMLQFDPAWRGPKSNGFKMEMERANLNLSLVDGQVALFHAWRYMLLELNSCLPGNVSLMRHMLLVAKQCLSANRESQGPENIFVRIIQARTDFALSLVQRLVGTPIPPEDILDLIGSVLVSITSLESPFDEACIDLHRSLLRTLFATLRAFLATQPGETSQQDGPPLSDTNIVRLVQITLTILDRVVCKGFRALVSLIHSKEKGVSPEDLSLVVAVLQACLSMPDMDQQQTQILNIIATHDAIHVASSLFSWSDQVTVNGDPVYGESSLLFLLELSKLPAVAEQMACDGLVANLSSANLSKYMQRATISPVSDNAASLRCYNIWSKAVLPLLLNLLVAMGPTVAPEVSYLLNQFPLLLQASVERFEAPGASRTASKDAKHVMTLSIAHEAHSLALLTRVLSALRANNSRDISEVPWDSASLVEYVDFWLTSRRILRDRLVPLSTREAAWKGMKPRSATGTGTKATGCESLLEEKVVSQLEAIQDVLSDDV